MLNQNMNRNVGRNMEQDMNRNVGRNMEQGMNQDMNHNMSQAQMLQWINEVSFAVTDVLLFLDNHPDDIDAINYFNHYNMEREKALELYASQYTPLRLSDVNACNHWNWVTDAWPWEGGCN